MGLYSRTSSLIVPLEEGPAHDTLPPGPAASAQPPNPCKQTEDEVADEPHPPMDEPAPLTRTLSML